MVLKTQKYGEYIELDNSPTLEIALEFMEKSILSLRELQKEHPETILLHGDLIVGGGEAKYEEFNKRTKYTLGYVVEVLIGEEDDGHGIS